jgi:hypothetical protein
VPVRAMRPTVSICRVERARALRVVRRTVHVRRSGRYRGCQGYSQQGAVTVYAWTTRGAIRKALRWYHHVKPYSPAYVVLNDRRWDA